MSDNEFDDSDEHQTMFWEDAATQAVDQTLESTEFDEVEGVIVLSDSTGDHRMAVHCHSLEELKTALEEIYDEQWYANVPFDGGVALHESDSQGYVMDVVDEDKIEAFFSQFGEEPEGDLIISASDLLAPKAVRVIRVDLEDINDGLIAYLASHPEKMRDLHPRKFEELVAELFKSKGYEVHLTPATRDGGLDMYAIRRDELGTALVVIECKRYAADNKVGVEVVRGLYGVVEQKRATKGLIATTSYFSADAKHFHNDLEYRLELADYDRLCAMLNEWRAPRN
jgi:hypothetical protein